jgi:hypothetical protein
VEKQGTNKYKQNKPKMSGFIKNLTVFLSEAPAPPPPLHTVFEYMYPCTYSHREGG